jgi:ABC-2 type transport system permease protein
MAVHRRTYKAYDGVVATPFKRWMVIPRYALRDVAASRALVGFLFISLVPMLVEWAIVYLFHNEAARTLLHLDAATFLQLDAGFFLHVLAIQSGLALVLAAWVGPAIVAPDLVNGALTLYLSRPISRAEYVSGKLGFLVALLSLVGWVPALAVFAFQADLAGWQWTTDHLRIPVAIVLAGLLWTIVIAFLSVVASVWVRWRMAATGLFLAIFFVGSGMGEAWAAILDTPLGRLTNLNLLLNVVWYQLFGVTPGSPRVGDIPASLAWGVLVGVALVALFLLDRRLRAREVVR